MEPKLMLVAVYNGTKSLANVRQSRRGLLLLMTEELAPAVRVCGQMSGNTVDKFARLQKRYTFVEHKGFPYFDLIAGFMELEFIELIESEGDHVLGLARVIVSKNLRDAPILTTDYLKDNHFIR